MFARLLKARRIQKCGRKPSCRPFLEQLEERRLLATVVFDTELTNWDLAGGSFPMPLASIPGDSFGSSIGNYGPVDSNVVISLSSSRATNPGLPSTGRVWADPLSGPAPQGNGSDSFDPIDPESLDGEQFQVNSSLEVFFDITVIDVDARPGHDFTGQADGTSFVFAENVPVSMWTAYPAVFDADAPNFGLIPPPESRPFLGFIQMEIPLGGVDGDINNNGDNDRIRFTVASLATGDEDRTFERLPDGTVIDQCDSAAFLGGIIIDQEAYRPFTLGTGTPNDPAFSGPGVLTGPTTTVSTLLNPVSNLPPVITGDNWVVTVDEGEVAANSGLVSDPDGDSVLLNASTGDITNHNDGTWTWSVLTDDGPLDGAVVTINGDDGRGGTDSASFTLVVINVAPGASVNGPASALIGESVTFSLGAIDPSSADQAAGFAYAVDWNGDGTVDQTVRGTDGIPVEHTFSTGGSTTVIVTATDKDGGESDPVSLQIEVIQPVDVDLKPGNSKNEVNAKSRGKVPVMIHTTADFDAATIDTSTIRLAGIEASRFAWRDVDRDGDLDLILHFAVQDLLDALDLDLGAGDEQSVEVELTGETVDEVMIQGSDTIDFFFPGKCKGRK